MKETTAEKTAIKAPHMAVDIAGVRFKNPVLTASGTFGYGMEFASLMDLTVNADWLRNRWLNI